MGRIPLKRYFNSYNKRFFGNKLPKNTVVKFARISPRDMGECYSFLDPPIIRIDPNLREYNCIARLVLVHEMAHLSVRAIYGGKTRGDHGPEFQAEMLRLAAMGALKGLW